MYAAIENRGSCVTVQAGLRRVCPSEAISNGWIRNGSMGYLNCCEFVNLQDKMDGDTNDSGFRYQTGRM